MRLAPFEGESLGRKEMFGLVGAWAGTISVKSNLLIAFKGDKPFFLIFTHRTKVVLLSSYAPGPGSCFFSALFLSDLPKVAEGEVLILEVRFH